MYYIVGLGNPGEKYKNTRHNVGRFFVEKFRDENQFNAWEKNKGANALSARGNIGESPIELLAPETYMNNSGQTVLYLYKKHNVSAQNIIVVHDDIDLIIGEVKISVGKGDGGHNGIKSIVSALEDKNFIRIRVGVSPKSFWTGKIKRPEGGQATTRFVLGRLSRSDTSALIQSYETFAKAVNIIVKDGAVEAMNQCN